MKKNLIVIIVLIVLVIFFGRFLFPSAAPAETDASGTPGAAGY